MSNYDEKFAPELDQAAGSPLPASGGEATGQPTATNGGASGTCTKGSCCPMSVGLKGALFGLLLVTAAKLPANWSYWKQAVTTGDFGLTSASSCGSCPFSSGKLGSSCGSSCESSSALSSSESCGGCPLQGMLESAASAVGMSSNSQEEAATLPATEEASGTSATEEASGTSAAVETPEIEASAPAATEPAATEPAAPESTDAAPAAAAAQTPAASVETTVLTPAN